MHFKEFMSRRDRPVDAVLRGGPRDCQTEWHALSGGLVKSERARLSGIVQDSEPPRVSRRLSTLRRKGQVCIDAPRMC